MSKRGSSFRPFLRKLTSHCNRTYFAAKRSLQWKLKRTNQFLLLLLMVGIVTACNSSVVNQNETSMSELPLDNCRVIQHMMGKSCVPNNPQRVVTVVHHMLGHLLAINVTPVGSNVRSLQQADGDYLNTQTYMGSETAGIEFLGIEDQTNVERILSLKPDLILASELAEDVYPQLSQIAPVVIMQFEDIVLNWKENFNFIAEVLNKEDKAQEALNSYYQRIEELKISLGDRYQHQAISVAGSSGSDMFVFSNNSFPGSILSDLGLERPETQRTDTLYGVIYNLSEESLKQFVDGDFLFFLSFTEDGEEAFRRLQKRPLWKRLKAVQKSQVYLVNGETWTGSNLLAADAVIDDLFKYLVDIEDM